MRFWSLWVLGPCGPMGLMAGDFGVLLRGLRIREFCSYEVLGCEGF